MDVPSFATSFEKKLEQNNRQMGEVMEIMWNNIKNIVKRGEKLEDVEKNVGILEEGAEKFKDNANKLKRREWWKSTKYSIVLFSTMVLVLILVGLAIYEMLKD